MTGRAYSTAPNVRHHQDQPHVLIICSSLATGVPEANEFLGHAAGIQLLQRPGVDGKGPGQAGTLGTTLKKGAAHARAPQVTG